MSIRIQIALGQSTLETIEIQINLFFVLKTFIYFIQAASVFDLLTNRSYSLNGFDTGRELTISLSSITLNFSEFGGFSSRKLKFLYDRFPFSTFKATKYDACASGDTALDPLCPANSLTPVCFEPVPNPWIFNCR